jgi:hypothetical protein
LPAIQGISEKSAQSGNLINVVILDCADLLPMLRKINRRVEITNSKTRLPINGHERNQRLFERQARYFGSRAFDAALFDLEHRNVIEAG